MKSKLLEKLEKLVSVLSKRRDNLVAKMVEIDNLPNNKITRNTYSEWHTVYTKVEYLNVRIAKLRYEMEKLANKRDIVRDFISGSKGLFQKMCMGAN